VLVGIGIAALGGVLWAVQSLTGLRLGRLPGDIVVERQGFAFFFPITTMILVCVVGTLVLWIVSSLRR